MVSPEKIRIARDLRAKGHPWAVIAEAVYESIYTIRGAVEPDWLRYRQNQVNENRYRRNGDLPKHRDLPRPLTMRAKPRHHTSTQGDVMFRAPPEVLEDRDRRATLQPASLTAALFGDPLPGRSALDKRRPHLVVNNMQEA